MYSKYTKRLKSPRRILTIEQAKIVEIFKFFETISKLRLIVEFLNDSWQENKYFF